MYVHVFSHYADKNGPQPQVLYIAVGTVAGVLLIVAIVATVAIVVCCKKCIRTKGNRFKRLSSSTAVMDSENVIANSTRVQSETQTHNNVRKNYTVYSFVYFMCVY